MKHDFDQLTAAVTLTLEQADSWVGERSLLLYQKYLYQGQSLLLNIKNQLFCVDNFVAKGGCNLLHLIRQSDQKYFVYKSQVAAHGYPLRGGQLLNAEDQTELEWPDSSQSPVVRIGQRNFAHFIWNELDGLLSLLSESLHDTPIDVVQDHNSVLDVAVIPGVQRCEHSVLRHRPSLRVGSRLVTHRARQLVLQQYDLHQQNELISSIDASTFKLLIGIRGPGKRSIENEERFYRRLLRRLSKKYQNIVVYFDALTFQNGYLDTHRDISGRQANCQEIIDNLLEYTESLGIKSFNLNGLYFRDWFGIAAKLNFYVTHQGTMQHKIGWFFPGISGYCLIGHKNPASIARWHAEQSEDAVPVHCLPEQFFKMGDLPEHSTVERDRRCRIRNMKEALDDLMSVLALQPGLRPTQLSSSPSPQ